MSRRAPPPREKKEVEEATGRQARRRLHTTTATSSRRRRSSAFRERLVELDMAEARREIAAALRVHRASSSGAVPGVLHNGKRLLPQNLQAQQQAPWMRPPPRHHHLVPLPSVCCDDDAFFFSDQYSKYWRGDRSLGLAPGALPAAGGGGLDQDLEYHLACGIQLPARPLGLNLSLHGLIAGASSVYNDDDGDGMKNNMSDGGFGLGDRRLIQAPPCAAAAFSDSEARSSPPPAWTLRQAGGPPATATASAHEINEPAACANPVVPERDDAASALTGGTGVEWGGDTAASWWSMEDGRGDQELEGGAIAVADDAGWLHNDDGLGDQELEGVVVAGSGTPDGGNLETLLDDGGGGDYCCWWPQREGDAQDITLPCMEIGEIEGWDGEWFA